MITMLTKQCPTCKHDFEISLGQYNKRVNGRSGNVYCGKECAGIGRRLNRTKEEEKAIKKAYDHKYNKKNKDWIREKSRIYEASPAGRASQKKNREKFKQSHLEYCRTPEYRAWKKEYDQKFCAKKNYGELWESAILLHELEGEYDWHQVKLDKGLLNKAQVRRREMRRLNK